MEYKCPGRWSHHTQIDISQIHRRRMLDRTQSWPPYIQNCKTQKGKRDRWYRSLNWSHYTQKGKSHQNRCYSRYLCPN